MRSSLELSARTEVTVSRELAVLSEVLTAPRLTQRELASRVGLSLSATNLLLQSLATKGYVDIRRVGWRRWLYTLTPSGIKRRVSLTTAYVSRFVDQYRQVRALLRDQLAQRIEEGERVAIYGPSELARLVHLALGEAGVHADVFVDSNDAAVAPGLPACPIEGLETANYGCVVVADLEDPAPRLRALRRMNIDNEKVEVLFGGPRPLRG